MNFDNIIGKLENDKLGMVIGFGLTEQAIGRGDLIGELSKQVSSLFTEPHIPDLGSVLYDLTKGDASRTFKPLLLAAIGGWILASADLHPLLNKLGRILKNVGFNGAIGGAGASFFAHATAHYSQGAMFPQQHQATSSGNPFRRD